MLYNILLHSQCRAIMLQMKKKREGKETWFYRWIENAHNDEALDEICIQRDSSESPKIKTSQQVSTRDIFFMNRTDPKSHFCINPEETTDIFTDFLSGCSTLDLN